MNNKKPIDHIQDAMMKNDYEKLNMLLYMYIKDPSPFSSRIEPTEMQYFKRLVLSKAVHYDYNNWYELLLQYIDVDEKDEFGATFLMNIIKNCYSKEFIISALLRVKDINLSNFEGYNALESLIRHIYFMAYKDEKLNGYHDIVKIMIDMGANIFGEKNSVHFVIFNNDIVLLKILFKNTKIVPIHVLIFCVANTNYYDCVEFLLTYISDVNEKDSNDNTVLWHARRYAQRLQIDNSDIINLLIESGAV